jgi:hypothetical protein
MVCDLFYDTVSIHNTGLLHQLVGSLINDELGFAKMLRTSPEFGSMGRGKPSVKIVSVPTIIRAGYDGTASVERYRYNILLGPPN